MYNVFVISGGTGFIGSRLSHQLINAGKKVYILTRHAKESNNPNLQYLVWDPAAKTYHGTVAEDNVCVVHLAGAGVADKRWNDARKKEILESRTQSTSFLHQLIKDKKIRAAQIVSASAIGIYASSNQLVAEADAKGSDYLANTCIAWENAINAMQDLQIPITILRIGLVMGAGGGAIKEFVKSMQFHIAGIPGSGKQMYSWIHVDDLVGIILHAANAGWSDTFNAVSPQVVSCSTLIKSLAKHYCGWFLAAPAPSFVIKLMLGEMSTEVLKSASISNAKLLKAGFLFQYDDINKAMQQIAEELKKK
jgi:uncharacterized protein